MRVPEVTGAFDAVARLVSVFQGDVWLVSKCGPKIEARTRLWLEARKFFERTQMARDHLRFCRERRDKAQIAVALDLDCFVDDCPDALLRPMRGLVPTLVLFGANTAETGMIAVSDRRRGC